MNAQQQTRALAAFDRLARANPVAYAADAAYVDGCTAALVVVGVDRRSPVSLAIDKVTGGGGYSHVYVDPCRAVDGERVVLDYTVRRGVHWTSPDIYARRKLLRIELTPGDAAVLWACARERIGNPLRIKPLVFGRDSEDTCIGIVVACLPAQWRASLEAHRVGPCISPNTLAAYAKAVS